MGKRRKSTVTAIKAVIKVKVNGTEKRYRPTRHYVYIIQVRWSDYSEYVVYRKYSDFYTLHCGLLDKFPIEAGEIRQSDRVIPFLPGRVIFSRAEVSKVANQRRDDLAEYCSALLQLDQKISTCAEVIDFFEARPEDINPPNDITKKPERSRMIIALLPFLKRYKDADVEEVKELSISDPITLETYVAIADYNAEDKSEVSLKEGMNFEVLEKNNNGWWFVQLETSQGWAPASYFDPVSHPLELDEPDPTYTGDFEKYITTHEYKAQMPDEISFEKDVIVEVMHKLLDGWWIISYHGEAGYAPAAFLAPYQNPHLIRSITMKNRAVKPIPRRCTLKQSTNLIKDSSHRDLSIYRKYSKKRKVDQSTSTVAPPAPKPPRIIEEAESTTSYEIEVFDSAGTDKDRTKVIEEEKVEYLETEQDEVDSSSKGINDNVNFIRHTPSPNNLISAPAPPWQSDTTTSEPQAQSEKHQHQHTPLPDDLDIGALSKNFFTQTSITSNDSECISIPDADLENQFVITTYPTDSTTLNDHTHLNVDNGGSCDTGDSRSCRSSSSGYSSAGWCHGSLSSPVYLSTVDEGMKDATSVTRL